MAMEDDSGTSINGSDSHASNGEEEEESVAESGREAPSHSPNQSLERERNPAVAL